MAGLPLDKVRAAFLKLEASVEALEDKNDVPSEAAAQTLVQETAKAGGLLPDGAETAASNTDPAQDLVSVELRELQALHDELEGQVEANADFFGPHGFDLYAGLASVIARFKGPLPVGREQQMLHEAISIFVHGVFNELRVDSEGRTRLMDDYRTNINQHKERVGQLSDQLSNDEILPSRIELESNRAKMVCELSEMHRRRAQSVSEPSRVPGLLREKLAEFQDHHNQHISELDAFRRRHDRMALDSRKLVAKQTSYKEDVVKRCLEDEANAKHREDRCMAQLRDACGLLVSTSGKIQDLLGEVKEARTLATGKMNERRAAETLLTDAIRFQEAIEAGSLALSQRFKTGQQLMNDFAAWLQGAYQWIEKTMAQKRAALEMQMPQEREDFHALLTGLDSDAARRKDNLQWAMAELVQKRDGQLSEAKYEEQVGTRRAKDRVRSLKMAIRTTDEELHAMQKEHDDLCGLQLQLKQMCSDMFGAPASVSKMSSFSEQTLAWVRSFFHNVEPARDRYVPPALYDLRRYLEQGELAMQQRSSWSCSRRRVRGKRPIYELEGPAPKRPRHLPLPN